MIKNLLLSVLASGFFSIFCIGQNPVNPHSIKTVPLSKNRFSSAPVPLPKQNGPVVSFKGEKCGSAIIHDRLMATDPVYKSVQEENEKAIQKTIADWKSGAKMPPPVYTIPVVFHVIHKGEAVGSGTNISDAQIQSAVDALNRDYRRTSADGGIAQGSGPDTEIQFCLATKDPSGNPTTGINRVDGTTVSGYSSGGIEINSGSQGASETAIKSLSKWPNTSYVNIWVVSEIDNGGSDVSNLNTWTGGILGYAYFPGTSATYDGIVALHCCVGNDPNQNKGYRLWFGTLTSRTLTHEMGHFLNLYHTFEGGSCSETNCSSQGDRCCDTPPHIGNNASCSSPECSGTQQVENYMDYTDESCQDMFSADQTTRARAVLATGGLRNSLTTSSNTNCTTCTAATVTISSSNPSCTSNNGSATANASGGTTPYTYLWSNGGSTQTISNLGSGTYTVTVTSTGGCTTTQSVTLTIPGAPSASTVSSDESAGGACDGTASVTASGGSSPYTYLWSNSATTSSISGLCAGTYTVTVTGSNSCSVTAAETVSAPAPPGCDTISNIDLAQDTLVIYGISPNDCGGSGWGYLSGHNCWDDRAKADFFTAASGDSVNAAILYFGKAAAGSSGSTIDVKIWNGATGTPGAVLGSVTVPVSQLSTTQPVQVVFSPAVALTGNFFCGIQLSANGTPQDTVALITNQDGETMPGTAWEMWNDNSWHHDSSSWGVNLAHAIWVIKCTPGTTPNCTGFAASATSTNPSCTSNNGTATASASGGTTPYSYLWSNSSTTASVSGLAAGTYSVTVTDAAGCTSASSVTLTSPAAPAVTVTGVNATTGCDGSATANASGGSSPYTYLWSNSATTAGITGLCAGTYTVTVTGSNGCTGTATATITSQGGGSCDTLFYFDGVYYAPQVSDTAGFQFNAVDNDLKTPDSSLIAYGINSGWQVYSEVVSPGDTNRFIGATSYFNPPGQADNWLMFGGVTIPSTGAELTWDYQVASNSFRDGYRVLINTTGASVSDFASATVLLSVPDNDPSTNGDTVWAANSVQIASPFVGQKVYIAFHHNATDQFLIFFDNITVKDCNSSPNCTGFAASATSTNPTCGNNNGTAAVTGSGGTSPYTYSWSNGGTTATITGLAAGTYTVTVTEANSCTSTASVTLAASGAPTVTATGTSVSCGQNNGTATASATGGTTPYTYAWSGGQTTATATGLAAGTYTVTVTGANSCSATASVTLTSPGAPAVTATGTNATCGQSDGTATASATGGTSPYTYLWSDSSVNPTATGLAAGSYSVTVTDASSCSATQSVTISVSGTGPTLTTSSTNASCGTNNGSATVSATGGTTPYSYSWSNGGNTATITGLGAGTYTVTVTGGCASTASATVTGGGNMTAAVSSQNTNCPGTCTGQASVAPSGGTSPYSFAWSGGGNTASQTGLCAGTYSVTITDNAGCTVTKQVTISSLSSNMFVSSSTTNATCNNSNGTATVNASGGATPYTYSWNSTPAQATSTATGLPGGAYDGIVTDANGCMDTVSVTVNNVGGVTANITNNPTICQGGSATLVASGGTGYLWNSGQTTSAITVSPSATTLYYVTVTDNFQCSDSASATVTVNTIPVTTVTASDDTVCKGDSVMLIASGGTAYFWNNGQTNDTITVAPNNTTTYTVTAQNGNCLGNQASVKVNVFLPSPNAVASSDVSTVYISQGGTVNFSSTGSTGIAYGWDFTGNGSIDATTASASYSYTAAGTYPVVLSVTLGNCTDYDTLFITVFNQPGTGIAGAGGDYGILIYPNPNDGKFRVSGSGFQPEKIEIFNMLGELVYERQLSSLPGSWSLELDTHFPTGVYYVSIKSEDKFVTQKISLINE